MHQSKFIKKLSKQNYNIKVLVLVAHTDDETFGYGGFIKKLSFETKL